MYNDLPEDLMVMVRVRKSAQIMYLRRKLESIRNSDWSDKKRPQA